MSEPVLSYFLDRAQDAWRWRLLDERGDIVACGAARDQDGASALAHDAMRRLAAATPFALAQDLAAPGAGATSAGRAAGRDTQTVRDPRPRFHI